MSFKYLKTVKRFIKDECGASMVEYGVALLVVTAIGVTAMSTLGGGVRTNIDTAITALTAPTPPAP